MKFKNVKLSKNILSLSLAGTLAVSSLTGCGNKQIFDFNKSFNVAIEMNGDNLSVVGIQAYSDYDGSQIQFVTNDNLRVISSTLQTQLLNVEKPSELNSYVNSLVLSDDKIINYDKLQGTSINYEDTGFNKDIFDLHYTYNKAIVLSDNVATIIELDTWKDYEDDKIQLKFNDGVCLLTNIDKVKLINDIDASEDSLKNYAISLVGDESKVVFYTPKYEKQKN